MTTQHTPGPYYRDLTMLCAGTPGSISGSTIVAEFKNAADASFAMRACNSHADLLAALRELVPIVRAYVAVSKDEASAVSLRIARAAIAKVEGTT